MTRLLLAVVAAVALVGCGDDDDSSTSSSTTGNAEAADSAFPATIEHKFGSTEIPEQPERVVTVGYTESDTLLALGIQPVAVREFFGGFDFENRPWAQDAQEGDPPPVIAAEELSFEAVAEQNPDLIIAINSGIVEREFKLLSKIAPTIAQDGDYVDFGMPWREQVEVIGRAVGLEDKAAEVIADVDEQFEAAKQEYPEFAESSTIFAYGGPDGYGAYASEDTRSRFLTDLGMTIPPGIDKLSGDSFYSDISEEKLDLLDEDVVFMYGPQKDIEANPAFARLKAAKEKRVLFVDPADEAAGAIGYASPLSFPYLIETVVPELANAADGDPKTEIKQPE